jgi:hypothetical protein
MMSFPRVSPANLADRSSLRQHERLLPANPSPHGAIPSPAALTGGRHIAIVRRIFALTYEA